MLKNPRHRYSNGGIYAVILTVKDDSGGSNFIRKGVLIIQTYDLTIEVKDVIGLAVAKADIGLYADDVLHASGTTDENGKLTLAEIPEGNYEIQVKVMGITTSRICALTQ